MHTHTPILSRTTGEILRAFAIKINDGNKLGFCSLLLVAGLAVTLAVMSQEISKEKALEIKTDYRTILHNLPNYKKERCLFTLKGKEEDVAAEHQAAWNFVKKYSNTQRETGVVMQGIVISIQTDGASPHAVVATPGRSDVVKLILIPQGICTEEGWGVLGKTTPQPEFANKWGYKIPDAVGVATTPGSARAIEEPKVAPTPPVITQATMPAERTITNTQGRAIEGTILSKTDTSISFQRKGATKPINIKLDTLSPEDQAFIATLVEKKATKPTLLFLVNQDYPETEEIRDWLTKSGFDIKIGVIKAGGYGPDSYKIPKEVPFIAIDPVEIIDQFDVVWINRFSTYEPKGKEEFSHFSIAGRRNQQQKLVVIPTHSKLDKKDRFLSSENYYAGSPKLGDEDKAYVKSDKNFIFCSDEEPHSTDGKMREKLLAAIMLQIGR